MHKETRFVWLVLLLVTVVTLALRTRGDYDHHDTDFAGGESSANTTACVPGFGFGAYGGTSVTLSGGSSTDSYNSAAGSYAATHINHNGNVGTTSGAAGAINLSGGASVKGLADTGGGSVSISGGANDQGNTTMATPITLTPVVVPLLVPDLGPIALSAGPSTLPPGLYDDVVFSSTADVTLTPGVYVMNSLTMTGGAQLEAPNGPVIVYLNGTLDLSGGTVTNGSLVSTNLVFFGSPTCTVVNLSGGANTSFGVYAPSAAITISGGADIYGAIVGDSITASGGAGIHYDAALANYTAPGFACGVFAGEISRASPIIATVTDGGGPHTAVVQGTYEVPFTPLKQITNLSQIAAFTFPYIHGHMRARTVSSISVAETTFNTGVVGTDLLFDAAAPGSIPPVINAGCATFNGTCRHIFTTTTTPPASGVTFHPLMRDWKDGNAGVIGSKIAPSATFFGITFAQRQAILRTVLAGVLGGVDRSTVAVVQPSPFAGVGTRPTIAYFGATDGMVHAVCASVGGVTPSEPNVCPAVGTEIWAFMPRVQLPLVRFNSTRVDGSLRVNDAFGDFSALPPGPKSFHTILTFQTGYSVGTQGATYAIDVTDPANPIVLWEHTSQSVPPPLDVGTGMVTATGSTIIGGVTDYLVVSQTNNGGSGGAGVVATAMNETSGATIWQFGSIYTDVPAIHPSGIPGGAVGVDLVGQGLTTDYIMGDLSGALWKLNAVDGTSRSGAAVPWFKFSTIQHPIGAIPAIYSNGSTQFAIFGSGGYVDSLTSIVSDSQQYLESVKLTAAVPPTLTEATTGAAGGFSQPLALNTNVFAQVLIVGTQAFVTTSTEDVNLSGYGSHGDTGNVLASNLTIAGGPMTVIGATRGGASSLANSGTTLIGSSADQQQKLATAATTTIGPAATSTTTPKITRMLWLRTL